MADRIAHQTVILEGVLKVRHPILSFVWYTRRFSLCADCFFRRYNGDQLRYLQCISSNTTVTKENDTDFVVCVNPPGVIFASFRSSFSHSRGISGRARPLDRRHLSDDCIRDAQGEKHPSQVRAAWPHFFGRSNHYFSSQRRLPHAG